jgi:hypothetical protein
MFQREVEAEAGFEERVETEVEWSPRRLVKIEY